MPRLSYVVLAIGLMLSINLPETSIAQSRQISLVGDFPASISIDGNTLSIRADLPAEADKVVVDYHSDRNSNISRFSDVSPHNPNQEREFFEFAVWYPVVDIMPAMGLEGVLHFEITSPGEISFNGKYTDKRSIREVVSIPSSQLEFWSNELFVGSKENRLQRFYLRRTIDAPTSSFYHTETLLTQDWGGYLVVSAIDASGRRVQVKSTIQNQPAKQFETHADHSLDQARLLRALDGVVGYTLRGRNLNPSSPTDNGGFLIYDFESRSYYKPDWIWPNGIAMNMLLGAAEIGELSEQHSPLLLRNAAHKMGEMTLDWVIQDPDHPAHSLVTSRYKIEKSGFGDTNGFREYINPADALFLAGYGWMPLYQATGDDQFLDAARLMVQNTAELVDGFDLVPMDYVEGVGWTSQTMNEHGFGMLGISELYRVTKDPKVYDIGIAYIDQVIEKLGREDGLWDRAWDREAGGVEVFKNRNLSNVKGQGWAMIGLMGAADMAPNGPYLDYAKKMAEVIMANQLPEGHWANQFFYSEEAFGASEKGTAIWSLMLYQLYSKTGDKRYLVSARRALGWLLERQYLGPDPNARGGIYELNANSGIVFKKWHPVTVTYTASFFGAALVEELRLQNRSQK